MKKTLLFATMILMMVSCGKKTFVINGTFDKEYEIPDRTEIGIDIKNGEATETVSGLVQNNAFTIQFEIPEEQLVVLDLGELGATAIAVEAENFGKGIVNINIYPNENDEVVISKNGTLNNDFIQMFDDIEADIYQALAIEDETLRDQTLESHINHVYSLLKGEENSLLNINTLAGHYGFLNFFPIFELDQVDSLCAMMNEKTLEDKTLHKIYNYVQLQKQSGEGKPFKDITASTPTGETLSLSDLVGKTDYVLVDFWASWCGPCRRAMPEMKALYDKYQGKLEILGVSLDEDKDAWIDAINSIGLKWRHISDLQGWQAQGAQDYGVNSIPCTLLIDKEGVIVGRNMEISEIEVLLNQ